MEFNEQNDREDVYSRPVRAGKRTYFFDVKSTKGEDLYLTITESKKRFRDDGTFFYEKHKIFLYKEDFEKFLEGFNDAVDFIQAQAESRGVSPASGYNNYNYQEPVTSQPASGQENQENNSWSNVEFDDLGTPEEGN